MSIFRRRKSDDDTPSEPEVDPVAYVRAHVTAPGAHALLAEVERGRQRRQDEQDDRRPEGAGVGGPAHEVDAEKFERLPMDRYIGWLRAHLDSGGRLTHVHDTPYPANSFLLARRDFNTDGECGASSRHVLVPAGVRHLYGGLGHCALLLEESGGLAGSSSYVPAFSDPEFHGLAGYADQWAQQLADAAEREKQRRAKETQHAARAGRSDLSAYTAAQERSGRTEGHMVHGDEPITVNRGPDGTVVLLPRALPTRLTPDEAETLAWRILAAAGRDA